MHMMAVYSPLELKDLAVIRFEYTFSSFEASRNVAALFSSYELDMDFMIRPGDNGAYHIYVKGLINNDAVVANRKPGYSITAESVGVFTITEGTDKELEKKLLVNSGVSMTLNHLRAFIAGTTGQFPLGKYLLPSIDLGHMIESKQPHKKKKK